jgi:AraC-like DNA-binding protein
VWIFIQGRKHVNHSGTIYRCEPSMFLLTSVEVQVVSQIVEASEEVPFLCLLLHLEIPLVFEVLGKNLFPERTSPAAGGGIAVGKVPGPLLESFYRLFNLLDAPDDIPFLGELIQREIVYHLLRSPQGGTLRAIATVGGQRHRTAKAVAWLRTNYTKPLRIEELAKIAQMGVSTLHHHFHALTAMSPLQYQKNLRLSAARERMLVEGMDVASAAYGVGYESTSQFNRDYHRRFGQSPKRDIKSLRLKDVLGCANRPIPLPEDSAINHDLDFDANEPGVPRWFRWVRV